MPEPTEPQLTESEVEDLLRVAGNGSLQFPLRVEGWHKSLSDGGWFIRQASGRIVMTVAFVPAETESGIPARDGNAPARAIVALLNSVPALIRDWRALRAANKALAADNVTMTAQVQKYRDEVDSLRNQQWTAERVIQWLDDPLPKPANTAFTAGNERQIAYRVERLRAQLEQAEKQIALWFGPNTCSVCGGAPLASGRSCVCGGKGTMQAEFEGLRQELFDMESQLAQAKEALTVIGRKKYDEWAFSECVGIAKNTLENL